MSDIFGSPTLSWWHQLDLLCLRMGQHGSRVPFISLFVGCMRLTWDIARSEPLDEKSFDTLRQTFLAYIQSEYTYGLAESNAPCMFSK
jgi:exportin-T